MSTGSQVNDVTPVLGEVETMVCVLEGRHGRYAAEVADFLSTYHGQGGDAGRSWAWAGVFQPKSIAAANRSAAAAAMPAGASADFSRVRCTVMT